MSQYQDVNQSNLDTCVPGVPVGKPAVSNITADSLTLAWYGPGYDGGSKVIGYKIEKASCGAAGWTDWSSLSEDCKDTCFRAEGLESNTEYQFRISVKNINGFGPPGEPTDSVYTLFPYDYDASNPLSPLSLSTPLSPMALRAARGEFPFKPRAVSITPGRKFEDNYILKEEIGKGRFGEVFLCLDKNSEIKYAAKFIKLRGSQKQEKKQEINIMNELQHPKLMMLWDAFETPRELIMVMEHVGGGELFDRIVDDDYVLTERECAYFVKQICTGVGFMHAKHIVHLDLKPENILCISHNSNEIKIIDFGLAKKYNPGEELKAMVGSAEFVAPEVINYNPIGFGADMWSIGVVTYLILSGISPFAGDTQAETLANVTKAEWSFDEELFADFSPSAKEFVSSLIVKDPRKRASASDCLLHKWLTQNMQLIRAQRISTREHKRYMARKKWHKSAHALRAINRLIKTSPEAGSHGELKHDASSQSSIAPDNCGAKDNISPLAPMKGQNSHLVEMGAMGGSHDESLDSKLDTSSAVQDGSAFSTTGIEENKVFSETVLADAGMEVNKDHSKGVAATLGNGNNGSHLDTLSAAAGIESDSNCSLTVPATSEIEDNNAGLKIRAASESHRDSLYVQSSTYSSMDASVDAHLSGVNLLSTAGAEELSTEVKSRSSHLTLNVTHASSEFLDNLPDSVLSTTDREIQGDRQTQTRPDSKNYSDSSILNPNENSNTSSEAKHLVSESDTAFSTDNLASDNVMISTAERRSNRLSKTRVEYDAVQSNASNSKVSILPSEDRAASDDKVPSNIDTESSTAAEAENLNASGGITPTVRSSFRISLQAQRTPEDLSDTLLESKDGTAVTVPLRKKASVAAEPSGDEIDNTQQQRTTKKISVAFIPQAAPDNDTVDATNISLASDFDAIQPAESAKSDKVFSSSIDIAVSGNRAPSKSDNQVIREGSASQCPLSVERRSVELKQSSASNSQRDVNEAVIYDSRGRTRKEEVATSSSVVSSLKAKFEQGSGDVEFSAQSGPTRKGSSSKSSFQSSDSTNLSLPAQAVQSRKPAADSEVTKQGRNVTDLSWQRKISGGAGSADRVVGDKNSSKNTSTTSTGLVASLRKKFANTAAFNASTDTDSGFTSPTNESSEYM